MVINMNNYTISIDEEKYFDDDFFFSLHEIVIAENNEVKMTGVVCNKYCDKFDFMRGLFQRVDELLNLPHLNDLPEPLQTIVKEQKQSSSGMLFYDNEEGFPFTEEELGLLEKQIIQYNLGGVMELNPDANKEDPIITCYMFLCTHFNFA